MSKRIKDIINKAIQESGKEDELIREVTKDSILEKERKQKKIEIEKNEENTKSVKKNYSQAVELSLNNKHFLSAIKEVRGKLGIPDKGFSIKNDGELKKWNDKFVIDEYKLLNEVINSYGYISTDPEPLLDYLSLLDFDIEWYEEAYFNEERYMLHCPSIKMFENHCNEKPFIGILEYILFNKVVIPNTRLMSVIEDDGAGRGECILLGISKNTTKRDILNQWPVISLQQKNIKGNSKGKIRISKNHALGINIVEHDKETEEKTTKDNLTGEKLKTYKSERLYNNIDENFGEDNDKKNLVKRRKIKSRTKKKIDNI